MDFSNPNSNLSINSFHNPISQNSNLDQFYNNINIPPNPILNHPLNSNNPNNFNSNTDINILNNNNEINNINPYLNNNIQQMSEEQKKEIEVENDIRDRLKCYICLSKVKKPKMCKFCSRLSCSNCINAWLSSHNYCGICKKSVTSDDMVSVPFVDDMSTYFINNIDNHPKHQIEKVNESKNIGKTMIIGKNSNRKNIIKKEEKESSSEEKENLCETHHNKIDYYCVQCAHYYCSQCLIFFGQEVKKHQNHLILQVSKMNDLGIKEAINEYKKLPETKNKLEHFIGLCNLKLKENDIKKCEFQDHMSIIKDLYMKKIEETTQELKSMLNTLKNQKERIENSIDSIPNGFNNIVNSNDHVQGSVMSDELKKLNKLENNIEDDILEKSKAQPRLFFENYQSDLIEITIPFSGQYKEGHEIFNKKIKIIPNNECLLVIKYLQNQVYVTLSIDISLPLNSPEYPKFYSYVVIQNQKYGLEFSNFSEQVFPQDISRGNSRIKLAQQINNLQFDFSQFVYLSGEDKKIKMKIYIMKTYFKG